MDQRPSKSSNLFKTGLILVLLFGAYVASSGPVFKLISAGYLPDSCMGLYLPLEGVSREIPTFRRLWGKYCKYWVPEFGDMD